MKRNGLPGCGILLAAVFSAPLQGQVSTNVANAGNDVSGLVRIQNLNGSDGSEMDLGLSTEFPGRLVASQSPSFTSFPLSATWYSAHYIPDTTAEAAFYSVMADGRPAVASPEWRLGVMGWLEVGSGQPGENRGVAFRVEPGTFAATFQLWAINFAGEDAATNESVDGLFQLDGSPASPSVGSAWTESGEYNAAEFATFRLEFAPPTAADKLKVTNATARVIGKVFQGTEATGQPKQVGETLELLTSQPVPATNRFGYYANWGTTFVPGETIGYLDDLVFVGRLGNVPPTVLLTSPAEGAKFFAPATVALVASAADANGSVAKVEFFQGNEKVGESTADPPSVTVSNLVEGTYTFTARATDNLGATGVSLPVTVEVQQAVEPTLTNFRLLPSPADFTEIRFTVLTSPGVPYVTEISSDLGTWTILGSGVAPSDSFELTYPRLLHRGVVYYRVRLTPSATVNQPPVVTITRPAPGAVFTAPAQFTVSVAGTDADGSVTSIRLYQGTALVGTAAAEAQDFAQALSAPGVYTFTAEAVDDQGRLAVSEVLTVRVEATSSPPLIQGFARLPTAEDFQQLQLTLTGLSGTSYRVEATADFKTWRTAASGAVTAATQTVLLPREAGPVFYRVAVEGSASAPVSIQAPALMPSAAEFREFQFNVSGLSGASYRVESTSDFKSWQEAASGPVAGSTRAFTFPRLPGPVFYRVVSVP